MELNTVIFDMDGLLIDSEPLWNEAANELFKSYGLQLTAEQYATTTGLRTKEFLGFWFNFLNIPKDDISDAEEKIVDKVIELVKQKGKALPGVHYIFNFFKERNFNIGLATSSPLRLINVVTGILNIDTYLQAVSSADGLAHGKPNPQVYLDCAEKLGAMPGQCICFEDSYNGMIAAKAARMKCIIVPAFADNKKLHWEAADLKISSLENFDDQLLREL